MISFGGVYLPAPTPANLARIEAALDPQTVYDWERSLWPGLNGVKVAFPYESHAGERLLRINTLFWPVGASRWAVGRFVVDDEKLDQIRQVVYSGSAGYQAATFSMDDGTGRAAVVTSLYMLTPRPIWQPPEAENGLWLMTLVDDRWFWWQRSGVVAINEGTTTWESLYSSIGSMLGVTITVDTVPSTYLKPTDAVNGYYEAVPELLDAVAHSIGQRIVRKRDGTVIAQNVSNARTSVNANIQSAFPVHAGGLFALSN